jgi:hypothetical protein
MATRSTNPLRSLTLCIVLGIRASSMLYRTDSSHMHNLYSMQPSGYMLPWYKQLSQH